MPRVGLSGVPSDTDASECASHERRIAPTLTQAQWVPLAQAHADRVEPWVRPHLARRSRQQPHPVEDFLWRYYSYPPQALRTWHPGWGVELSGDVAGFGTVRGFEVDGDRARVDPALPARRAVQVREIRDLLVATQSRPARPASGSVPARHAAGRPRSPRPRFATASPAWRRKSRCRRRKARSRTAPRHGPPG